MRTQLFKTSALLFFAVSICACDNGSGPASIVDSSTGQEPTYEQKVMSVEETEKADPTRFLQTDAQYRNTILGNKFVVFCDIRNNATVATYKDAVVRIRYYSKTNTLLDEEDKTIYESFGPNSSKTFEWRVQKPSPDAEKISVELVSAVAE